MFWPGLAQKPQLWLGPRWLWLSWNLVQTKASTDGLALAWLLAEKMCILAWHNRCSYSLANQHQIQCPSLIHHHCPLSPSANHPNPQHFQTLHHPHHPHHLCWTLLWELTKELVPEIVDHVELHIWYTARPQQYLLWVGFIVNATLWECALTWNRWWHDG